MASGRGLSGHLPSECSAFLTNAECQGKCLPDDAHHRICLADEECQGICLLNAVHVFRTQSVKTDVVQMRSVRAFAFWMQRVSPDPECQGKCLPDDARHGICLPDKECQGICLLNAARVFQMQRVNTDVVWTRSIKVFAFWTQHMSYRHRMPRQMSSGQGVSGHLPSERSTCLTDAQCQGRCRPDEECQCICLLNAAHVLQIQNVMADVVRTRSVRAFAFWSQRMSLDAECQGKCFLDDARHSICLPDGDCQGIYLLNEVGILRTQNVKLNVDQTTRATASAFPMRSVRAFAFWTQCVYYRRRVSRKMSSG